LWTGQTRYRISGDQSQVPDTAQYPTPNSYAPSWNVAPTDNYRWFVMTRKRDHGPRPDAVGFDVICLFRLAIVLAATLAAGAQAAERHVTTTPPKPLAPIHPPFQQPAPIIGDLQNPPQHKPQSPTECPSDQRATYELKDSNDAHQKAEWQRKTDEENAKTDSRLAAATDIWPVLLYCWLL